MNVKKNVLSIMALCLLLAACSKPIEVQIQEQLDLGNKYLTEMNYEQAVIAFAKAIELDEKNIAAYEGLGSVYMAQENYEEGIDIYNKLIELDGGSWSAYEGAARAYEALSRRDEAIAIAERGLKAADVSEEGKSYVIGLYRQVIEEAENDGDYERAFEYLRRIQAIDPNDTRANEKLAMLTAMQEEEEREKQRASELVGQITDALDEENTESLQKLVESDEFKELFKGDSDRVFIESGKGLVGLYLIKGQYYLYEGDFKEYEREGTGSWYCLNGRGYYKAYGEWKNDKPNGHQEDYSILPRVTHRIIGTVIDGRWHGTIKWIQNEDPYWTFDVNCNHGKPEILEISTYESETSYIFGKNIHENGKRNSVGTPDPDQIFAIWGFY